MTGNDYYYVDKTGLIAELLRSPGRVILFTCLLRFGRTLTMTMLKCFFKIYSVLSLFDGLAVENGTPLVIPNREIREICTDQIMTPGGNEEGQGVVPKVE